jgi:ABC-type uncharacterized transport system involved in gliding motility auxiliary subunit
MTRFAWIIGAVGVLALLSFGAHAVSADAILTEWAVVGGAGAVAVLAWLVLDRQAVQRYAASRGARYSVSALALVAVVGGALVALNVLAMRHDQRVDITVGQRHALAPQTEAVVTALDTPVEVVAFFSPGTPERIEFEDLIDGYTALSDQLTVAFHDPLAEPMLAREFEITSSAGTVVLRQGESQQRLETRFGEEALTNAIVRLTSGTEHRVCFATGHEELDPDDDQSASGLGLAVLKLEGQNYQVERINVLREGGVPARCESLVVADPQVDWPAAERELLARYLVQGGAAVVMLEPARVPGLAGDLARYNVAVGDDIVLEQNAYLQQLGGDASYLIVDTAGMDLHAITNPLKGGAMLRIVRSVGVLDPAMEGLRAQELVRTSAQAWAERDYLSQAPVEPTVGTDRLGPVPLVTVVEIDDPEAIPVAPPSLGEATATAAPELERKAGGRLIVFGDAEFASNELLDQYSNADLFLNSLAWLSGEAEQISIRPSSSGGKAFTMSLVQGLLVFVMSLIVAPGLALMGAIGTWRQRRAR